MSALSYSETAAAPVTDTRIGQSRRNSGVENSLFEVNLETGIGRRIESGSAFTDNWILDRGGLEAARVFERSRAAALAIGQLRQAAADTSRVARQISLATQQQNAASDEVVLTVEDDGAGIGSGHARGGIVNMGERALDLGGSFEVGPGPDGTAPC